MTLLPPDTPFEEAGLHRGKNAAWSVMPETTWPAEEINTCPVKNLHGGKCEEKTNTWFSTPKLICQMIIP